MSLAVRLRRPALAAMLFALAAAAEAADEVTVVNLPRVQEVRGSVTLSDPARVTGRTDATRFVAFEDRDVPPIVGTASPRDYQLIGTIRAEGYASVLLSIATWVPAGAADGGNLGVMLLPDYAFAKDALDRDGAALLPLRVEIPIARASAGHAVAATSERLLLSFPRWRVYLYNTSASTLKASAYVMMGD